MLTRLRSSPDTLLLLVAATCVGFGNFYAYGAFTPRSLKLVAIGCIAVGAALVLPRLRATYDVLVPQLAIVTVILWQGLTLVRVPMLYGHGHGVADARYLSIALPVLAAAALLTGGRVSDWWWRALVVAFSLGAVATIRASPRPRIDVWYFLQHTSDCVLRGCDLYTVTTPDAPGAQHVFPYLPMTAVLLAPFRLVLHDVRYGEALAIVVAALLLRRCGTRSTLRLSPLLLCVPGLFFQVEQAWTESLLLGLLVGAAAVSLRGSESSGRWIAGGILLGLALASKQHMWLLLPVVALTLGLRTAGLAAVAGGLLTLPWFAVNPSAFWHRTVTDFVDVAPRSDALTIWLHEPVGLRHVVPVLALLLAYLLAWFSCRRVPHRLLLGCAVALAAFDLTNKASFYNQWVLVTWLLVAAAALELEFRRQ
jgi:hypothetical protein